MLYFNTHGVLGHTLTEDSTESSLKGGPCLPVGALRQGDVLETTTQQVRGLILNLFEQLE